jgi:BMFP domain-containing protein YqiC
MFDISPATALSFATLVLLAVALALQRWQLGRLHTRLALLEQRSVAAEQSAGEIAGQLGVLERALAAASIASAQAQARQADLGARVEVLETQATGDQPYGDAIRLVRQGAREARLVDELGLSPIEAGLIVRLHGGKAGH